MRINFSGRFFVAVCLLLPVGLCIYYDWQWLWELGTLALAAAAAYEWGRLAGYQKSDRRLYAACFLLLAALAHSGGGLLFIQSAFFGLIALFWVTLAPWWVIRRWAVRQAPLGALGLLAITGCWQAATALYAHDAPLLLAGMALVWVFDSASYFTGRFAGRAALAPSISPKKTVEGLLGGIAASLAGGGLYYYFFAGEQASLAAVLAAVFSLAMLAMLGDLFISAQKRIAGVKDSGRLLGEHGGVLDRMDSLLPVLPIVALLSPWIA